MTLFLLNDIEMRSIARIEESLPEDSTKNIPADQNVQDALATMERRIKERFEQLKDEIETGTRNLTSSLETHKDIPIIEASNNANRTMSKIIKIVEEEHTSYFQSIEKIFDSSYKGTQSNNTKYVVVPFLFKNRPNIIQAIQEIEFIAKFLTQCKISNDEFQGINSNGPVVESIQPFDCEIRLEPVTPTLYEEIIRFKTISRPSPNGFFTRSKDQDVALRKKITNFVKDIAFTSSSEGSEFQADTREKMNLLKELSKVTTNAERNKLIDKYLQKKESKKTIADRPLLADAF